MIPLSSSLYRKKVILLISSFLLGLGLIYTVLKMFFPGIVGQNIIEQDTVTESGQKVIVNKVDLQIDTDGAKTPVSELANGCPFKDCIPAIDNPEFESVKKANKWLNPNDRVFILTHGDITKIYPQRIMNWHEIVNDWYAEDAIAVTFCPLCGTATAFERIVDNVITEFGVSGKLHNSDLIMYDRYEGSLWQQATGEAITGPAARRDEYLDPLFLVTLNWDQAMEESPEALVLSRNTGTQRDYNRYPYGQYETNDSLLFETEFNESMHPKEWVYGITVNEVPKAYRETDLQSITVLKDIVGETSIVVQNDDGIISFTDISTGDEIVPLRAFWFAWSAFNPGTGVYGE